MNRCIRIIFVLWTFLLIVSFCGCGKSSEDKSDQIIKTLLVNEDISFHEERLFDRETPYTICYKNTDGSVSMYIFPLPISYVDENENLKLIDTTVVDVEDSNYINAGYILQTRAGNVISYFPRNISNTPIIIRDEETEISINMDGVYQDCTQEKSIYTDLIGVEHSSAKYSNEDIVFECIPTSSGTTINIEFNKNPLNNEIAFYLDKQTDTSFSLLNNEYVILNSNFDKSPVGIVQRSFLRDFRGKISLNNSVKLEEVGDKVKYTIMLDQDFLAKNDITYPVSTSVSFDIIQNSLINVTSYSEQTNDMFSGYSLIGTNEYYGNGSLYTKYRVNYFVKSYKQNIRSASYNFVNMGGSSENAVLSFERLKGFWNSDSSKEELPIAYETENNIIISDVGAYSIDITSYIKACIYDDTCNTEDFGLLISNENDKMKIIANYNNTLYKPYVRIDFYDMPWTFEHVEKMDPSR